MPTLDAIRGLAILLVLAHRFNIDVDPESMPARAQAALMEGGWVGVQLFFVLSGFLITGILLDSRPGADYFRPFFARRALRIFPLYFTVLVVAFVVVPLTTGQQPEGYRHQVWLWTYLSNWAAPFGLEVAAFPHFWSLAVEEQFYLIWPFVIRFVAPRGLAVVCASLIVLSVTSRVVLRALGADPEIVYQFTICRVDALALGAAAAWALRVPELARAIASRQRLLVAGTTVLFLVGAWLTHDYPRTGFSTQTYGYTVFAWTSVVLVVVAVLAQARAGWAARLLSPAPLRSLGKYSFAMYVFHTPFHHELGMPMLSRLGRTQPQALVSLVYFIAMSAITYGAAVASYHLLEKHFLRLKSRFRPARAWAS